MWQPLNIGIVSSNRNTKLQNWHEFNRLKQFKAGCKGFMPVDTETSKHLPADLTMEGILYYTTWVGQCYIVPIPHGWAQHNIVPVPHGLGQCQLHMVAFTIYITGLFGVMQFKYI